MRMRLENGRFEDIRGINGIHGVHVTSRGRLKCSRPPESSAPETPASRTERIENPTTATTTTTAAAKRERMKEREERREK